MKECWFQLPQNYQIDVTKAQQQLDDMQFIKFDETTGTPGYNCYYGVGLTYVPGLSTIEKSALQVHQKMHRHAKKEKSVDIKCFDSQINPNIEGYLRTFLESFKFPPGRALLAKLVREKFLYPHRDLHYEGVTRVHWPIVTTEENQFIFYTDRRRKKEQFHMHLGQGYAVDTTHMHAFVNRSKTVDRVHLIVDFHKSLEDFKTLVFDHAL